LAIRRATPVDFPLGSGRDSSRSADDIGATSSLYYGRLIAADVSLTRRVFKVHPFVPIPKWDAGSDRNPRDNEATASSIRAER